MSILQLVVLGVCVVPLILGELVIDDEESIKIWHHFKLKYNKLYKDPIMDTIRREAFERNMERALVRNLEDDRKSGKLQPGLDVMYHHRMDDPGFVMFGNEHTPEDGEMYGNEGRSEDKMMFQDEDMPADSD